jgi:transposase InsO family protein
MDTKRYARFDQPGHAVTGDRTRRTPGAGYTYAHAIVDDHTRLAYVELHDDETAETVTAYTTRALAWFASHRIHATRLMTDNAWAYTKNKTLATLLADNHIRHIRIRPYRPRTNGKVERFHQTMAREWGYGQIYLTDQHRAKALPYWLRYYNEQRPHSALAGQSPTSRVRNLPGHDS